MVKKRGYYADGGQVEFGEDERPAPEGMSEATKLVDKPAEPATFGAAFKAARAAGDKTFMFKGKKYTTELASSKPSPAKNQPKAAESGLGEPVPSVRASAPTPPKRGFYENAQRAKDQPETKAELTRESRRGAGNDKTTDEEAKDIRAKKMAKRAKETPTGLLGGLIDNNYARGGAVRGMGKATRGAKACKMR